MEIDPAATAWLLTSTALVLLMTPGLAIFYGGMVRSTGVLNMIMMSFISIPVVTLAWLLLGYTLAFGQDAGGGLIGNLDHIGLLGIDPTTVRLNVPELLFVTFQLGFAIVTAALISGAIADRARFSAWMAFVLVWAVAVYAPVAHWVWGPDGWLAKFGAIDYAGGLVVEVVSGSCALALALVLGPRIGFKSEAMRPHNLPFVLLGVGLLWFGWFGFNAGLRSPPTARRPWSFSTRCLRAASACWAGSQSSGFVTAVRRRSAPRPASWQVWWRSRRHVDSSRRSAPC